MGRKPLGKRAMTGAERTQKWMQKKFGGGTAAPSDASSKRIAELEAALAAASATRAQGEPAKPDDATLRREVEATIRRELEAQFEARVEAEVCRRTGELPRKLDWAALKAEMAKKSKEAAAKAAATRAARARAATPDLADTDTPEVAALKLEITRLKQVNSQLRRRNNEIIDAPRRGAIIMSKRLTREIRGRLHPDRTPDPAEKQRLTALFQEFSALTIVHPD